MGRALLVPNTRRHNLEGFIEGTVDDDTATIYMDVSQLPGLPDAE